MAQALYPPLPRGCSESACWSIIFATRGCKLGTSSALPLAKHFPADI